jgi:fucose 4-O-acetylase-like acetyltransferase
MGNMTSDQKKPRRVRFLDVAKGVAISLVVFGHVLGGALSRNWIVPANGAEIVYKFIYMFHMPFFFIVSGALAIDHIRRDVTDAFVSRCGSIAWPYLLWSAIMIAIQSYLAKFMLFPQADMGAAASLARVLLGETYWFLWALFICQLLLMAAAVVPVIAVFCASLLVALIAERYDLGPFKNVIHFMPYMALGAMIGGRIKTPPISGRAVLLVCSMAIFGLIFLTVALGLERGELTDLLCGMAGSTALLLLAYAFASDSVFTQVWSKIGEASLAILLLHTYAQGAARMLVTKLDGPNLALQLVAPTLAGILVPALIWLLAERFGFGWLFRLPIAKDRIVSLRPRGETEQAGRNCSI